MQAKIFHKIISSNTKETCSTRSFNEQALIACGSDSKERFDETK